MVDAKRDPRKEAMLQAQIMGIMAAAMIPTLFLRDKGITAVMQTINGLVAQNMPMLFEVYYAAKEG